MTQIKFTKSSQERSKEMIITVTMNPAIDKTVEIEQLVPNGLNRIQKVEYDAGGKGINVSKTIHELGGESLAMGFLGGNAGKTIENVLTSWNIQHDFIWVEGETRTNTKVFEKSGGVTELNEPGPVINEAQVEELIQKICRAQTTKQFLAAFSQEAFRQVSTKTFTQRSQRVSIGEVRFRSGRCRMKNHVLAMR